VLVYALHSLSAMAPHLRKRTLLAVVSKLLPLLQHPAVAVRAAVVGVVAAAARALPPVDVYTRLSPMVSGVLGMVPLTLTGGWWVCAEQGLHTKAETVRSPIRKCSRVQNTQPSGSTHLCSRTGSQCMTAMQAGHTPCGAGSTMPTVCL
jgi:hypothetical protein